MNINNLNTRERERGRGKCVRVRERESEDEESCIVIVQRRIEIRDRLIQDFVKKRKRNFSTTSGMSMVIEFRRNNMY